MNKSEALLGLRSRWMNAAGFMGYLPQPILENSITPGVFVTNPISLHARTPAHHRTILSYPGGLLIHTGHPNPGLSAILKHYRQKWEHQSLPIWPHLLVQTSWECRHMVTQLEDIENITAIELGLPPGISLNQQIDLVQAAVEELPVFVCIPLDAVESDLVEQLSSLGAAGIVLTAPRGMIRQDGKVISGRLFGPSLHPLVLRAICDLKGYSLPIIAGCGIFSIEQGEEAISAGAEAVQVDLLCWRF